MKQTKKTGKWCYEAGNERVIFEHYREGIWARKQSLK
jgi:hypothetical protein